MITGQDVLVARELRKDALVYAEKERLFRQVRGHRFSFRKRYQLWLASLGVRMVAWGQRLQARYANASIAWPAPQERYGLEGNSSSWAR